MKTLKFNTNSWHYYLADECGNYNEHLHGADLCAYSRRVLLGGMKMAGACFLLSLIVAAAGYLFFNVLFGVIFSFMMHCWFFTEFGEIGVLVFGLIAVLASLFFGLRALFRAAVKGVNAIGDKAIENPDSFASNAYKAWHNKFCAKIDFE